MMRGLLHQFVSRQYRHGPFILTLTDLHQSNIFVDEDWNITSLIDLEWACSFPTELQTPPYWLTGRSIDDIEHGEHLQTFEKTINEFINIFEEQEQKLQGSNAFQAQIIRQCWNRGRFWYFQAAHSPKGLCRVFNEHIQRRFCEEHCTQRVFDQTVSPYWCAGADDFIQQRVKEEAEYKYRLRKRFNRNEWLIGWSLWNYSFVVLFCIINSTQSLRSSALVRTGTSDTRKCPQPTTIRSSEAMKSMEQN